MQNVDLDKAIFFINSHTHVSVTIDTDRVKGNDNTYWPGICLEAGSIHVDPEQADIGDLLHEVGHLVTLPSDLRVLCSGEIGRCEEYKGAIRQLVFGTEKYICPGSDNAASYWAFCACRYLGLDDKLVFNNGYPFASGPYISCCSGVGTLEGSRFSEALFRSGMLSNKGSDHPIVWDCLDLIKENQ